MDFLKALFFTTLNERSLGVLVFAFAGGVTSSLLPCTVGMLPILIGYMGGYAENGGRMMALRQTLLFMAGFCTVLTALGVAASLLGLAFAALVPGAWYVFLGAVAILMGLQLLGCLQLPLPQLIRKMPETQSGRIVAPILLGMAFGAASSPCGTPFLTGILGLISHERNLALGSAALFAYALGQSVLLLVAGLFTGVLRHMATLRHVGAIVQRLSGFVFILAGLVLIAQGAGWLNALAFE